MCGVGVGGEGCHVAQRCFRFGGYGDVGFSGSGPRDYGYIRLHPHMVGRTGRRVLC